MVSLPGSSNFIGKRCVNLSLVVSLSFPSIWSPSGQAEAAGPAACGPWPLSAPLLSELSCSPSQTAAQSPAGGWAPRPLCFQGSVRRSVQRLVEPFPGQAVPRAVPALRLHGGCSCGISGHADCWRAVLPSHRVSRLLQGRALARGWSGTYCLLKTDLLNPAVPFENALGLLRYVVGKQ